MTPEEGRDRAVDTMGQALAQVKHVRYHLKDDLGPEAKTKLEDYSGRLQQMTEELGLMDLRK